MGEISRTFGDTEAVIETYMTRSERNYKLDCLKGLPLNESLEIYVTATGRIRAHMRTYIHIQTHITGVRIYTSKHIAVISFHSDVIR